MENLDSTGEMFEVANTESEAEVAGADCDIQTRKDLVKLCRCVLKPSYRFQ